MNKLIPTYIEQAQARGERRGEFSAAILFVDLSGFTKLTESLMQEGLGGAEQLSVALNAVFEPLVEHAYSRGGFIPYFAGDAFTAIFPGTPDEELAAELLLTARQSRQLFMAGEPRLEGYTIGVKYGLSMGTVEWGIVGEEYLSYYFRGAVIDRAAIAQSQANIQEIVVAEELAMTLAKEAPSLFALNEGFYRYENTAEVSLEGLEAVPEVANKNPSDFMRRFLPQAVIDYKLTGEFRQVVTLFIAFKGRKTHSDLNAFASKVIDLVVGFSGYFKEIDYGDKGSLMVAFFGAPVSYENNAERALACVEALKNTIPSTTEMPYRIGMSEGLAFTGIIGGRQRQQYAVVGNRVNMAARLMSNARWGTTLVDDNLQKHPAFEFEHRGDFKYKGIAAPVPTFQLLGRQQQLDHASHDSSMVGRADSLLALEDFSGQLFERGQAGVANVFGEAGIGKSRLSHELKAKLTMRYRANWVACPVDQILRKPFNPFIHFLQEYFGLGNQQEEEANRKRFNERYDRLLERLEGEGAYRQELQRLRPVIAALLGMSDADGLWAQLDARGRYDNTISAIVRLILASSHYQPLVIYLEDTHWLDSSSRDLLRELVRYMAKLPVLLLMTSRYADDGSKPWAVPLEWLQQYDVPELELNLTGFSEDSIRAFAENSLQGEISEAFLNLLKRSSSGNPFYLEQMLAYAQEQGLAHKVDGVWHLEEDKARLSDSINSILTARIDRLSERVRETVKAASVIGREFDVPVLSEVLRRQPLFRQGQEVGVLGKDQVVEAEQGQIWWAVNEIRYMFRHALLHEAVYSMQLKSRLRQLHRDIAESIEQLYAQDLEERYVDLAYHYEQAEDFDKTCEYLRKAADYARTNYQNQLALDFYERLLQKIGHESDALAEIHTLLDKGRVLELIGEWDDCQTTYERALHLAVQSRDVLVLGRANNALGHLLLLKGDYAEAGTYLRKAAGLFEVISDQEGTATAFGYLGNLYFRQGKYDEAKRYFEKCLALQPNKVPAEIVSNLGLTYMNQGAFSKGIRVQKQQLEICEANNDKQGMATLYTNLGIVYFAKGNYKEALTCNQEGLRLAEELGNKFLTAIAIGSIGSAYQQMGDFDTAEAHFARDLQLCEELGDKQGTAIALGLFGELYSIKGEFIKAIEYLQKNLMICEELGYQKGIAKALNTLGDVFRYLTQHDRSINYYDRAIHVARAIENQMVLGESLIEKGEILVELKQFENARIDLSEAMDLATQLGNPDLLVRAQLLHASLLASEDTTKAEQLLHRLLRIERPQEQLAEIHYSLSLLPDADPAWAEKSKAAFAALYASVPRYHYQWRLEQLG